jgi:hypothetical protein
MCETCREAGGAAELDAGTHHLLTVDPPDGSHVDCECECSIRKNSAFLKFRPLMCDTCLHVAMD